MVDIKDRANIATELYMNSKADKHFLSPHFPWNQEIAISIGGDGNQHNLLTVCKVGKSRASRSSQQLPTTSLVGWS